MVMFLNGLNDDIQFQLLNTDYTDFQHMDDKAVVMDMEGKRKVSFHGHPPRSNIRPGFS
jgi:phosphomevalonate kinase